MELPPTMVTMEAQNNHPTWLWKIIRTIFRRFTKKLTPTFIRWWPNNEINPQSSQSSPQLMNQTTIIWWWGNHQGSPWFPMNHAIFFGPQDKCTAKKITPRLGFGTSIQFRTWHQDFGGWVVHPGGEGLLNTGHPRFFFGWLKFLNICRW